LNKPEEEKQENFFFEKNRDKAAATSKSSDHTVSFIENEADLQITGMWGPNEEKQGV